MILGIYGTGGTGEEVFEIVKEMEKNGVSQWNEIIFIDDTKPIGHLREHSQIPFIECQKQYSPDKIEIVIAIGEPSHKTLIRKKVETAGYQLATIIHPNSYISESAQIGKGVVVKMQSIIFANATIGDNVIIQSNVVVGHDVDISNDCQISAFSHICGNVSLGERVFCGAQSGIREKISIGNDCVLAMGAMVMDNMTNNTLAIGNPAKFVKRNKNSLVFNSSER